MGTSDWGKRAFVDLGNGMQYAVGHLTAFALNPGDYVHAGDIIGFSGGAPGDPSSGETTGPHVEFQFLQNGVFQDPEGVLQQLGLTFDQLFQPGTALPGQLPANVGGGSGLDPASIFQYALQAGFSPQDAQTITAISQAESGGNPSAIGDQGTSFGLTQIHTPAHPELAGYNLFDPLQNLQAAFQVFQNAGNSFYPWTTYNTGAFEQYLGDAGNAEQQVFSGNLLQPLDEFGQVFQGVIGAGPRQVVRTMQEHTPTINITNTIPGLEQVGSFFDTLQKDLFKGVFILIGIALIGTGIFVMAQQSKTVRTVEADTGKAAATAAIAAPK